MRGAWLVARWEYLTRIRSKYFIFSTLLFPLLIVGMTLLPLLLIDQEPSQGLTLAIVDGSGEWETAIGDLLDSRYQTPEGQPRYERVPLVSEGRQARRAEGAALLEGGIIHAYLVIEPEFNAPTVTSPVMVGTLFCVAVLSVPVNVVAVRVPIPLRLLPVNVANPDPPVILRCATVFTPMSTWLPEPAIKTNPSPLSAT